MPVMGMEPVTTAIFMAACNVIMHVIPAASSEPKVSGALNDALNPRAPTTAYSNKTKPVPRRPSSSPMMAKMKSVCCSGRYWNFCLLMPRPTPKGPPEPMASRLWMM
ncbi:MAG: hypothetical protein BWY85_01694 [Firmicutes bacterium ADurb.Bin506]|nr:MAG: hypothetical protein BWY85_01694 [Firmicutes bacterium ADurb.Bin506]